MSWRCALSSLYLLLAAAACGGCGQSEDKAAPQSTRPAAPPDPALQQVGAVKPPGAPAAVAPVVTRPPATSGDREADPVDGDNAPPPRAEHSQDAKRDSTAQPVLRAPPRGASPQPASTTAKPTPAEPPASAPSPAPQAAAAAACGDKGQPQCPLQAWMEQQLQTPLDAGDLRAVAAALMRAAELAPEPSWNTRAPSWRSIAQAGRAAAAQGDAAATQRSCKACHQAFRREYRAQFRQRPLVLE